MNGKEYNNGKLIYEGGYLDGEKNGKGIEYNINGEIIFEGQYLKGERNKGKEYYEGKLLFEGEYLNGKKWNGKGKGSDESGEFVVDYVEGITSPKKYLK